MTKKDYVILAEVLYDAHDSFADSPEGMRRDIINRMADALAKDNSKFHPERFKDAAL